jgi:superfamily II DNA or RNA helicase
VLTLFKEGHKRVILQAPPGFGKSVTFIEISRRASKKGSNVLILTDRIKLYNQTKGVFESQGLNPIGINAETQNNPTKGLVVAMVQTYARRMEKLDFVPDLIIIDECHEGIFNKVMDNLPTAHVIGVTATPDPAIKFLAKYYTAIAQGPQIKTLINEKVLVKPKAYQMLEGPTGVKTTRGDFDNQELFTFFDKTTIYDGVYKAWCDKAYMKKTIIYCVNIEHAQKTAELFGDLARVVTSKTEENDAIIEAHKRGEFLVLVNVMILVKGYDDPSLECIILNFATKILSKFLQAGLRGARYKEGKTGYIVLDMGENHTRHGLLHADRDWSIKKHREKHTLGASPVRKCVCGAMLDASAKECPYCGHVFPVPVAVPKFGVLQEVLEQRGKKVSECSISELVELEKEGRFKPHFVWRVLRSKGESALIEYSEKKGYSFGWVLRQLKENCNYKDVLV